MGLRDEGPGSRAAARQAFEIMSGRAARLGDVLDQIFR
jgi:hypothetical protein